MTSQSETVRLTFIGGLERAQLGRCLAEGRLLARHQRLLAFVREERAEILKLAAGQLDPAALSLATRQLIATLRTVHHQSEMHDQMREIHNEIWFCGERGDHDTRRITRDWVERHGSHWRDWRIKEYLFLAEHCAAELADALNVS